MNEVLTAIPATIAALAAWRAAAGAKKNTNGALHGPLSRIEETVKDVLQWQIKHDRRHEGSDRGTQS